MTNQTNVLLCHFPGGTHSVMPWTLLLLLLVRVRLFGELEPILLAIDHHFDVHSVSANWGRAGSSMLAQPRKMLFILFQPRICSSVYNASL